MNKCTVAQFLWLTVYIKRYINSSVYFTLHVRQSWIMHWYIIIMLPPPTLSGGGITFSGRPSVRPLFVDTYFRRRDISVLSGGILMKLGKNIHHVSGKYRRGFQGQRSKVKVIARWNALFRQIDTHPSIIDQLGDISLNDTTHTSVRCPYGGGISIDGVAVEARLLSLGNSWEVLSFSHELFGHSHLYISQLVYYASFGSYICC